MRIAGHVASDSQQPGTPCRRMQQPRDCPDRFRDRGASLPAALTIFDCDGVLVDSEAVVCRVCVPCLAEAGIVITADELADRYIGISATEMVADMRHRYGVTLSAAFQETMRL